MATFELPKFVRTAAALPAAGAFSSSDPIACNQYKQIAFQFNYTRGAAGGAVTYKIEFTNSLTPVPIKWKQTAQFDPPAIVAGTDTTIPTQRALFKYQATGGTEEGFMSPVFNVSGNFVRISVAESGAVGTPGTASVEIYLRGDQT
jgi:hypothetical protein